MPRPQRVATELIKMMSWASGWQSTLTVWGTILIAIAAPSVARNSEVWKGAPLLKYVVPALAIGALFAWALFKSLGPDVKMGDLERDPHGADAGVRLTNKGETKIAPRLTLIAITPATGEKRNLLRNSRPFLFDPPNPGSAPVLSIRDQSAFVRVAVRFRDSAGNSFPCLWVPKEGVEAGPPVSIGLLILSGERRPILITIGADCGEGIAGNTIHKTFRIDPKADGGCEIRRVLPLWSALARFVISGDPPAKIEL
jgi:hypothetical protein